ncbi:hypothetical protein N7G274_009467 [Stereocaulon virgatum]|uniref:P-loop containing nucleoside triphosphate hydrolase protein n=1 Tax=Stereocaulon virgatum TaxID=373712 RepID=A0ABR4A090_9LECA
MSLLNPEASPRLDFHGMAINDALRALKPADLPADNATSTITQLPTNILEAFIPGYSVISKFLLDALGFDITLIVSVCFLLFGLATSFTFAWKHAYRQFEEYLMSFIRIDSDDDIHDHIMEWLANQKISKTSRKLMAKTGRENAWDIIDGAFTEPELDPNNLMNFNNWDAKVPPRFQPSFGSHRFFHKGHFFQFKREEKQVMNGGWPIMRDEEYITLTCIGRSTEPIKCLIKEAREFYLEKEKSCTVVRRPSPKEQRGRGRSVWMKVATRPSRPIETVVLELEKKNRVLADINEYLHPSTPRWYANRGIPYRRGYLLHGPPGTGKSSLAWAIAGVFGLDIYCISLVDPNLTEEDLSIMFNALPRRCVVLLEDIDAAGLNKRQETENVEKDKTEDAAAKIGAEITKAFKSVQNHDKNKEGISLSGLLNAIDGVASHEGRVLIMTTNFPDKLDDALIRPGRIDMKVEFTNATRSQIYELFVRMYSPDSFVKVLPEQIKHESPRKAKENLTSPLANGAISNGTIRHRLTNNFLEHGNVDESVNENKDQKRKLLTPPETPTQASIPDGPSIEGEPTSIVDLASEFARRLPADIFTPAEVQGYLLTRKKEPARALREVTTWKDYVLEAREKKALATAETTG